VDEDPEYKDDVASPYVGFASLADYVRFILGCDARVVGGFRDPQGHSFTVEELPWAQATRLRGVRTYTEDPAPPVAHAVGTIDGRPAWFVRAPGDPRVRVIFRAADRDFFARWVDRLGGRVVQELDGLNRPVAGAGPA
jgi:hypothetical protein